MKQKCLSIWLAILAVVMAACQENENLVPGTGFVQLKVSQDLTAVPASGRSVDITRQVLAVDFCKADGTVAKHIADLNKLTDDRVLLEVGTYSVKVTSTAADGKLGFEQPAFYGESAGVAVQQGKTTPATVTCALTCVKVTTKFTAPVQKQFPVCVATVTDGSRSLDFDKTETRAGYFSPGYLLVNLKLANEEGVEFTLSKLIEKTLAKDHYALIFDLVASGDNDSSLDFDIKIETDDIDKEEHTVTIPLPDTGYGQEPPVVTPSGNVAEGQVLRMYDSEKSNPEMEVMITAQSGNLGLGKVQLITSTTSSDFAGMEYVSLSDITAESETYQRLTDLGLHFPTDYSHTKETFTYQFSPSQLKVGDYRFTLLVQDVQGQSVSFTFGYSIMAEVTTVDIADDPSCVWATFAYLKGNAKSPESGACSFLYRPQAATDWTELPVELTGHDAKLKVTGLTPGTDYEYQFKQGDGGGEIKVFTTETEPEIPNLDFNSWSNENTPDGWWSSGNEGTSAAGLYSTKQDNTGLDNSSCVRMTSSYLDKTILVVQVKKFVAGNLFMGSYSGTDLSNQAAKLSFGKDYRARPSKLSFYFKYKSTPISRWDDSHSNLAGTADYCHIYIALTNKTYEINSSNQSTFFSPYDAGVIAYGEFYTNENMDEFTQKTITLSYRRTDEIPKYLLIVASSSKLGDYFTGGEGSTLWLDNLDLIFDDNIVTNE